MMIICFILFERVSEGALAKQTQPRECLLQHLALTIAKMDATLDVVPQDPVFFAEILVAQGEFLVDRSGNIGEQFLPIHALLILRLFYSH